MTAEQLLLLILLADAIIIGGGGLVWCLYSIIYPFTPTGKFDRALKERDRKRRMQRFVTKLRQGERRE